MAVGRSSPRFDLRDLKLRIQTLYWLWILRSGLAVLPYPRLVGLQRRICDRKLRERARALEAAHIERIAWTVERLSRFVPGARCLAQALAGQVLLAHRGIDSELKFGVMRSPEKGIRAHAWLEREGTPILGASNLEQYSPLTSRRGTTP